MHWLEISVTTDGEAAEAVAELLRPYAQGRGVVLEQMGDPLSPNPNALEPEITVKIFIPSHVDNQKIRNQIEEALYHMNRLYPVPAPQFRMVKEEDWASTWKKQYKPFRVGRRLWICPSWLRIEKVEPGDIIIKMDPGSAFGTGLHPSTQMCLRLLEDLISPGIQVLDVGTGSGILSIAAAKLGAADILALDIDSMAVRAARENSQDNGVFDQVRLFQGVLQAVQPRQWDLVLVNIIAPVIVTLLESELLSYVSESGFLVLSGIIDEQEEDVTAVIRAVGGSVIRQVTQGDWVALVVKNERTS
jgi:ribosomal protein L11 methyltransferase